MNFGMVKNLTLVSKSLVAIQEYTSTSQPPAVSHQTSSFSHPLNLFIVYLIFLPSSTPDVEATDDDGDVVTQDS